MTRKRFIKLLMSQGESRNSAIAIAFLYNATNTPYKKAYLDYLIKTRLLRSSIDLSLAFQRCGSSLQSVAQAFNRLAFSMKEMNVSYDT
jgi:hypothetical protein